MFEQFLILFNRYILLLLGNYPEFTEQQARSLAALAANYTLDPGRFNWHPATPSEIVRQYQGEGR